MKTFKEQKWMLIVYAVIFIAVGLVELILSIVDIDAAIKAVSYSIAAGLFVIGAMHLLTSFITDTKAFFKASLVLGAFLIAIGVVLVVEPYLVATFLIPFVAVLALAMGAIMLTKAILAIIYKYKVGWIILYFVFAAIAITFGVLILVYNNGASTQAIYAASGAAVVILGIVLLVFGIKLLVAKDDNKKED